MERILQVTQSQEFHEGGVDLIRHLFPQPLTHHVPKPFGQGRKEFIQNMPKYALMMALGTVDKLSEHSCHPQKRWDLMKRKAGRI
jgi:hypothetical protein